MVRPHSMICRNRSVAGAEHCSKLAKRFDTATQLPREDTEQRDPPQAQNMVVREIPNAWITVRGYLKSKLNVFDPIFAYWHAT